MNMFTCPTMCLDAAEQRRAEGPLDEQLAAFSILRRAAISAMTPMVKIW